MGTHVQYSKRVAPEEESTDYSNVFSRKTVEIVLCRLTFEFLAVRSLLYLVHLVVVVCWD